MKKNIKKVAVIHDIVSVGKAAMTNIIPVISHMGIEACPIPTVVLSTHLGGYGKPEIKKLNGYITGCKDHYIDNNIDFDCIFAGYLGDEFIIDEAKDFISKLKRKNTMVVVDPILGDHGKMYSGFDNNYLDKLRNMLSYADIITPNLTEACLLTGVDYDDHMDVHSILNICKELKSLGCKNIVITSVPGKNEDEIDMAVYDEGKLYIICSEKISKSFHGTGDIFASALIGYIMKGYSLVDAAGKSGDFVAKCMKNSMKYDYPEREGLVFENILKELR